MDASEYISYLTGLPSYLGQIAHTEHVPGVAASYGELDKSLPAILVECLKESGHLPLYCHQAEAINCSREGRNVIVATPSASGKSLCYYIPVLEAVLTETGSRALFLYPTKALAQDQLRKLRELASPRLAPAESFDIFDGDTAFSERSAIRKKARVVLSNPDMLHVGILPNHRSWSHFLRNLRYVVVDEAHVYRGVFGSHVAAVLRRLRRLCHLYNAKPQFIACSATLANAKQHAEKLLGSSFTVVDGDGSPHGGKEFIFWNPPLIDKVKGARRSANSEATELFTRLVSQNIRTLTFVRTRRLAELIYSYSRRKLAEMDPDLSQKIKPYRAGYLPELRRQIERALFQGELLGVVATTALELGIDIGDLEATVLTGYPGSIASTWQQAGRSGRRQGRSLSFLIALDNPLDQYLMRHPDFFFEKSCESALVNPDNPYILRAHLLCAAWEQALVSEDAGYFGPNFTREVTGLVKQEMLRERKGRWYLSPSIAYPAQGTGIRSISGAEFTIIDTGTGSLLETVDSNVALFQVYPGAIYLHQGESFLITHLDLAGHIAHAKSVTASYYTQTKEITDLNIERLVQRKGNDSLRVFLGKVTVTTAVIGFKKKRQYTDEVIGEEPLDLPPYRFPTVALWFDLPLPSVSQLDEAGLDFAGGLHALEHAAIALLPLFALCDRNDIGGVSTPLHPDTGSAQVFIYDAYPGGIGIAEKGFELIGELWQATLRLIRECPCREGCPGCIQSPKCGNNNQPLDKKAAEILLHGLIDSLLSPVKDQPTVG